MTTKSTIETNRLCIPMNHEWKFKLGETDFPGYKGIDDSQWKTVRIPHDWAVEEEFSQNNASGTGYLPGGIGWYRKTFKLDRNFKGKKVKINFDGVYNNSQVWCNSYYLGKRPYGYSAFEYDITPFVEFGDIDNVISVKVNHTEIADSRWYTGSGIYRDVTLTLTEDIHFSRHGIFTKTNEIVDENGQLDIQVDIDNESQINEDINIVNSILSVEGDLIAKESYFTHAKAESTIRTKTNLAIKKPIKWSVDQPYLYTLVSQIIRKDQIVDEVKKLIGIRTVHFDASTGFYLNDISMKLKGVCLHHDAGCLGAAVPKDVWRRRLKRLKELGCNAIRMSHNPPASNLLDLCDEMGFLVIDEAFDEWEAPKNKWWQGHNVYPPKQFGSYEHFHDWAKRDIQEMVKRDRNHTSIIAWSIGNEVDYPNDPYCHPLFKEMTGNNDGNKPKAEREYDPNKPNSKRLAIIAKQLVNYVKECDISRPVTAALAFPELSNQLGYSDTLDIVGYNYREKHYKKDCQTYPDRVLYGSENDVEYSSWLAVRDNEKISGLFLWTGIDYLGEAKKPWPIRMAQSGLMDVTAYRKSSYYLFQSLWQEKPMVYMTTQLKELSLESESKPCWKYNNGDEVIVSVYTNCEETELFINNESVGRKKLSECNETELGYNMSFELPYTSGTLRIMGYNKQSEVCEFLLKTYSKASQISIVKDKELLIKNSDEVVHLEVEIQDDTGQLVYESCHEMMISIEGPGEIIGIDNGVPDDLEVYTSRKRRVNHGHLLVYVRALEKNGSIKITIEAKDLKPSHTIINVV